MKHTSRVVKTQYARSVRERKMLSQNEALARLLDVILSHRAYCIGPWLVLHIDVWFITIEIGERWVIGIDRAGWGSRPFVGRVRV